MAKSSRDGGDENKSNTPAEGQGDQGHGAGDPKILAEAGIQDSKALETGKITSDLQPYQADQGQGQVVTTQRVLTGAGTLEVNDPNTLEKYQPQGFGPTGYFQSDEARAALADPSQADELNKRGVRPAQLDIPDPNVQVATDPEEQNKLIVVKPKESVTRFRVGDSWYTLQKDQEMAVPRHIATLLEQKGYI